MKLLALLGILVVAAVMVAGALAIWKWVSLRATDIEKRY